VQFGSQNYLHLYNITFSALYKRSIENMPKGEIPQDDPLTYLK
jgi:hypothetical protein